MHIRDEVCTGPSVGKVISGDDVDSLAINLDELKKVSACSPLDSELYLITALFTNMRILKFKTQLAIAFFTTVNHLNKPLRKQNFTLTGSKGHSLGFVIGGFRSVLCVSVFQGLLLVIVIMIDGSEKRNCESGF